MNHANDYRQRSSSFTGRACRSTCERWPDDPVRVRSSFWRRLLILVCGF